MLSPPTQKQSSLFHSPICMFQHLAPVHTDGHTTQAGTLRAVSRIIWVGLILFCLPHTGHCTGQPQVLSFVPTDIVSEGTSTDVRISPLLQLPSPFHGSGSILLSSFFSSIFHPIQLHGNLSFLSGVCDLLLVFSWCAVRIVPFVDVFLIHLWREMHSNSSYFSISLCLFASIFKISFSMLPGELHGQRRLEGYSPWGHKESDTAKQLTLSL